MFAITYQTKKGGCGVLTSSTIDPIKKKLLTCFKSRLNATVYYKGELIGKSCEMSCERTNWGWFLYDVTY